MKVDKSKFICELDGYKYYLGDVIAKEVDWFTAKKLVEALGDGWGLPSRAVAMIAHEKFVEEMKSVGGWYWLKDEYSPSLAWNQHSIVGCQGNCYGKSGSSRSYVRPVYKEKVKTRKPKIKLLKVAGFSDLVLDIDGKKVLYERGEHSVLKPDWPLSESLFSLDAWYYEVVSDDFLQWHKISKVKSESTLHKKIYHIREKDEDGNILARGGVTVVLVEGYKDHWYVYASMCHPDDNYNKKVGVEVALSKKPLFWGLKDLPKIDVKESPKQWKILIKSLSK